jgi:hypothetical protein
MWVATLSVLVEVTCVFLVDSDLEGGVCDVCGVVRELVFFCGG